MSVFTFLFIHSEHFCKKSFITNEQKQRSFYPTKATGMKYLLFILCSLVSTHLRRNHLNL